MPQRVAIETKAAAIVLAGGSGTRSGLDGNKVYGEVCGLPVISYALRAFEAASAIDDVVLVARDGEQQLAEAAAYAAGLTKLRAVVAGGAHRYLSEAAGIRTVAAMAPDVSAVAIHDGARPFVTADLIDELVGVANRDGGAVPGLPIAETVLEIDRGLGVPVGGRLVTVQTPQAFSFASLEHAFSEAVRDEFSGADTAETVARYTATTITVVAGDPRNIKVTFPTDFERAKALATEWSPRRWISAA